MSAVLAVTRLTSFGALAFSWSADRGGRRRPFLWAFTLLCVAAGSTSLAANPLQFTLLQGMVRVATTSVTALAVVLLAENLSAPVRAYGISLYGAAGSLGAGMALMTLPLAEDNFRLPYALSVVGLPLLLILSRGLGDTKAAQGVERFGQGRLRTVLGTSHRRSFLLAASATTLTSAFFAVGLAFSTERLVGDLGFSTGKAVLISISGGTLGAVGFFVGGRLADLWGRRPTSVLALSAALVGGLGLFWLEDPVALVVVVMISGFGSFAYVPAAAAHRAELFPARVRATATTAIAALGTLGSAGGLLIGSVGLDRIGLPNTMALLGGGMAVAILLTLGIPETHRKSLD
jgi:MFS family permease